MKKTLTVILVFVTTVSLTACGIVRERRSENRSSGIQPIIYGEETSVSSDISTVDIVSEESANESEIVVQTAAETMETSSTEENSDFTEISEENSSPLSTLGLSCESIYDDYAKQIEDTAAKYINKINSDKSGDIEILADIAAEGDEKLAELCAEGIEKMADTAILNAASYTEWSTKLTSLYMSKYGEITSAYTSASIGGAFGGLDGLGGIFGGYDFEF